MTTVNYKFRKKPEEIEAFQMTKARRADNSDWPTWLHKAWQLESEDVGALFCVSGGDEIFIRAIEGVTGVCHDDWIIRGVHQGLIFAMKPDLFEQTYETAKY